MARTRTITDDQILDAARTLFNEKGMSATSAEIAKLAGVSEGTIFRRFSTKHDLFRASMGIKFPPAWFALTHEGALEGDFPTQLSTLLNAIAAFFEEMIPCMMLMRSNDFDLNSLWDQDLPAPPPILAAQHVQRFIERAQAQGFVREDVDALVVARTLIGAMSHYGMMHFIGWSPDDPNEFTQSVIATFWKGIAPLDDPSRSLSRTDTPHASKGTHAE